MCKKGIIDRFEGDWAIVELEAGGYMDLSLDNLPPDVVEGSVIYIQEDGKVLFSNEETLLRKEKVKDLMDKLFED